MQQCLGATRDQQNGRVVEIKGNDFRLYSISYKAPTSQTSAPNIWFSNTVNNGALRVANVRLLKCN